MDQTLKPLSLCFNRSLNIANHINALRPRPHVFGWFKFDCANFLSGFVLCHYEPNESSVQVCYFFSPLTRVEIFEYANTPESCGPSNPHIFSMIQRVNKFRSSLVNIQHGFLTKCSHFSCYYFIPELQCSR